MEIDTPEMNEADILADLWVELARDQFDHGSHLAAENNRTAIYESICQHIVTGGVLVARISDFDLDTSVELDNSSYSETDIVGFVMFTTKGGQYDEIFSIGSIENIYVVADLRERGIGSALLTAAEDTLKTDGIEIITLDVMAANKSAQRFYARHGYDAHRVTMSKDETDTHSKGE